MDKLAEIKLHISGVEYTIRADDITPETSLNSYLRDKLHLTGTKRMCLEGGCGCCVVAVEETVDDKKRIFAVNSCLVSIFSCDGWKIHTVEGIGGPLTKYHPIQKVLAEQNGTQCGFCSSGMVMNMYALNESGALTKKEIENSFAGNLCRCTGYRPILTAFKTLATDNDEIISNDIEDLLPCQKGECVKKCENKCKKRNRTGYYYMLGESKWMKMYHLKDLLDTLSTIGTNTYMLVAGNTAKGVYRDSTSVDVYIDVTNVDELTGYTLTGDTLVLGGNIALNKTKDLFYQISKENPNFAYLETLADHIDLVANVPVRNIGTIAGNLTLKHTHNEFSSDIFLILETFDATLVLADANGNEVRTSPQDYLKINMDKRVIKNIILKQFDSSYKFLSYKIMTRAQNTHALVNAGFLIKLNNNIVQSARIVYGSISSSFIHAENTETYLVGKNLFNNNTLQGAYKSLDDEIKPDYVLPEPRPAFRKLLAISLFYKFVLFIAPDNLVSSRNKSGATLLQRPVSTGVQEFKPKKEDFPLGEPVTKLEALAQTSGQAQYIADIPDLPNQLYAAFVTAKSPPSSVIDNIDPSPALKVPGVVAFFGKDDIPGVNDFMPFEWFPVKEEIFCSGTVKFYDQPIGIIVADSQRVAITAAQLVEVAFTPPTQKPFLTTKQVLDANATDRITHQTSLLPTGKGNDVQKVVKGNFNIGMQYHFHMEVQCCNVVPTEDSLDIYPSSQWMDLAQLAASAVLNIPMNRINVHVRRLGGGFGAKISRNTLISCAAGIAAQKLRRPVKMWLPLQHNMAVIGKRFPLYTEYEVGVDNKGVIQYLEADLYTNCGIGGNENAGSVLGMFENCYDISPWTVSVYQVNTDIHANTWARAPGTVEGLACIESIMEHIAYDLNIEASDVKIANIDNAKHPKLLQFWKDMQSWGEVQTRKQAIHDYNQANRWKKRGLSLVPMAWTLEVMANFTVLVSIFHVDGGVVVSHGGIEVGQGINTKVAQVCAYKFNIPLEKVAVKPSYNVIAPNSSTTGGSLTSEAVCHALIKACDILLERIKPVRDKMKNPTWEALINQCYYSNVHLSASGFYSQDEPGIQSYLIYGVCATEVELDLLTGKQQILRVDILEDVGDSMSPLIDIGQVEGAFVMGIGYYTSEEIIFNEEGQILTNRTWNYRVPGAKDIPINFRIKFPENNPNPVGVLRSKAIAEPPICISCAVPLAIRNALAAARTDADPTQPKWIPFDGPTTVEATLLNSLNDYTQYVL